MQNTYKVLGADYCPYCNKVKNYLEKNNISFEWIDTETPEGQKARTEAQKKTNHKTIPIVFKGDKYIGGCDDFFKTVSNSKIWLYKDIPFSLSD